MSRAWNRVLLAWLLCQGAVLGQDLEPRRWTHLPVGLNVAGVSYVYTDGDIAVDPVLELEDVEVESFTTVATYARTIDVMGKTGRIDFVLPYQNNEWTGLLSDSPARATRDGFADPWIRMSVNLMGAPALKGKAYQDYRAANPVSTVVGTDLAVMLPLGEYKDSKLLNLGQNRFIIRPQAGVVHIRGQWSYELTGSTFFLTENDDFFDGNRREQDPVGKSQALEFVYIHGDKQEDIGVDTDSLAVSWSVRF